MANAVAYEYSQGGWRDAPPGAAAGMPTDDADDADADWEYEYSTTETETHLITLDLSLPEFVRRRKEHIMHNTRGGFRSWMNPIMNNDDAPPAVRTGPRPAAADEPGDREEGEGEADGNDRRRADDDDDNDDDHPPDKPDAVDAADDTAADADGDADGDGDDTVAPEIQVLDLHGAQPLFAYRGVVLTGAWTEPIGTELVFGEREEGEEEEEGPTAVATHAVADGVALLGAATARIQCTPVELRGRQQPPSAAANTVVADKAAPGPRLNFSIPVATNASAQRQKQAAFLEQLMAAKHRAGEADVVTVQALETTQDAVPAGDDEEAQRRARRVVQAARDQRRVLARRERERERRERGERVYTAAEPVSESHRAPSPPSPVGRRKRGRTAVDGVAGDDPGPNRTAAGDDPGPSRTAAGDDPGPSRTAP